MTPGMLRAGALAFTLTMLVSPTAPAAPAGPSTPVCPTNQTLATNTTSLPPKGTRRTAALVTEIVCVPAPPTPFVGPSIAPEHLVGGPDLARAGIITNRPAQVPPPPDNPHVSYVLADLDTGEILAAKAPHALLRPASAIKALTALVVIPVLPMDRVVLGADEDAAADGTRVGIVAGAPYTVSDLLNGLILSSGNDAAYALARAYGGRDKLLADMNLTAADLGAYDTVVKDPSGLDVEGQRTSAYDLALIGRAVMDLPEYRERAAARTAIFPGATIPVQTAPKATPSNMVVPPFEIANHNPLLDSYAGVIGVKNGYTTQARHTYIGVATRNGRTLLIAELGSPIRHNDATAALFDWGFEYAAALQPVGSLVDPGTADRPPEWGGDGEAVEVTEPGQPPLQEEPLAVSSLPSADGLAAKAAKAVGAVPGGALSVGGGLVAVSLIVLAGIWRRSVRRPRGAFER